MTIVKKRVVIHDLFLVSPSRRWDTVESSPPPFHTLPAGYDERRSPFGFVAPAAAAVAAVPATHAGALPDAGLLAVDVMKLADGRGFAGTLAPVVESTGGCTYRVVVCEGGHGLRCGDGSGSGSGGNGEGRSSGGGGAGVGVHVSLWRWRRSSVGGGEVGVSCICDAAYHSH